MKKKNGICDESHTNGRFEEGHQANISVPISEQPVIGHVYQDSNGIVFIPLGSDLITHAQVAHWLGYETSQKMRIRKALDDMRVTYTLGRDGRVCTTASAINSALVGKNPARKPIEFA
jgi:hypothetical protein